MGTLLFGGSTEELQPERLTELIEAAAPLTVVVTDDPDEMRHHLADTIVAVRNVPLNLLVEAPNLRWYQRWYAGVEDVVASAHLRERGITVTNASGVHAEPMAEQVFAMLLALARGLPRSMRNQAAHQWPAQSSHTVWELSGKTMLVVGLGAIGSRIAEIAGGFDMTVIGIRRSPMPEAPFRVVGLDELTDVLPESDIVVCVLPLTDATRHVFNADAFAAMKPGSVFVNIGRGGQVDQDALIAAIRSGHLGAAGLDVTDPEPLPDESPLWDMENVILTPHMGGITPVYGKRVWTIVFENLRRFHAGETLLNVVDFEAGY
jgi:phosphoglycerate dehydrogenase-like enzyme